MAESRHALLIGSRVGNVVVTGPDTPAGWLEEYVAEHPEYTDWADVPDTETAVSIGYFYRGGKFLAPHVLDVSGVTVVSNGTDAVEVTYTDNSDDPPASVVASVNGQETEVALVNGTGTLEVTSNGPAGDTITVVFPGETRTLEVV